MKNILSAIVLVGALSGCVATSLPVYVSPNPSVRIGGVMVYEPEVYVGPYYIGYFIPGNGYWTGNGWDLNFYFYGHPGYGHYYRGAPRSAWDAYYRGHHH
jgi:hypothetical protein